MSAEAGKGEEMGSRADVDVIKEAISSIRKQLADVEQRIRKLEIREELLESPSAAGDGLPGPRRGGGRPAQGSRP